MTKGMFVGEYIQPAAYEMGEWEKKEDKCGFYEKQDAYCTKTQNKNCENIENDEKILMIC